MTAFIWDLAIFLSGLIVVGLLLLIVGALLEAFIDIVKKYIKS